jgi:hypothetical protein
VESGDINGSISSPPNPPGEGQEVTSDFGQESIYISGIDASKCRAIDYPGMSIMAASSAHVFAMKARATRTRDIDEIRLLATSSG